MGKKRRKYPDVEEVLARPWCYYCERDFEDLKLLISHQKAKHFKCDRCGRRLNTAGGLSVHMNQVHKENLSHVENALPNRQGLDVEIFGMEGIPADILEHHRNRIIQNFYQAQEDRRIATGNNPVPGRPAKKKLRFESKEELLARLHEHQAMVRARRAGGGVVAPAASASPAEQMPGQQAPGFAAQGPPGATPTYPGQASFPPPPGPAGVLPPRPVGGAPPGSSTLPQRPGYPGGLPPPPPGAYGASTLDELVAAGAAGAVPQGDDIDQLIRMAEAGIKPPRRTDTGGEAGEEAGDKKAKKDKGRMVYADTELSPEERMAMLPRYAFVAEA